MQSKAQQRQELNQYIMEFLAKGGEIRRVSPGVTANLDFYEWGGLDYNEYTVFGDPNENDFHAVIGGFERDSTPDSYEIITGDPTPLARSFFTMYRPTWADREWALDMIEDQAALEEIYA